MLFIRPFVGPASVCSNLALSACAYLHCFGGCCPSAFESPTSRPHDSSAGPLSDDTLDRSCGPASVLSATPGLLPSPHGSLFFLPLQALRPPPPDPPTVLLAVVIACQVADPIVVVSRDTTSVPALFSPTGRRVIAVDVARRVAKSLLLSTSSELHCLLAAEAHDPLIPDLPCVSRVVLVLSLDRPSLFRDWSWTRWKETSGLDRQVVAFALARASLLSSPSAAASVLRAERAPRAYFRPVPSRLRTRAHLLLALQSLRPLNRALL